MSRGTIFWDFDGTLVHTWAMWSGSAVEAIQENFPDRSAWTIEQIRPHLQDGFPWHSPERPHPELNDPAAFWSILESKFEKVFGALGFAPHEARILSAGIRSKATL